MKKSISILIIVILVILGIWYLATSKSTPAADTNTEATTTPTGNAGINGGDGQTNTGQVSVTPVLHTATTTKLGTFLVATNGMTLYKYTKDTAGVSNCSGTCATNWPPYIVSTLEPLMADMATGTLATITRTDGSTQLTYNGMPLYYYIKDTKVGDVTGQNVGGVWFVVKP